MTQHARDILAAFDALDPTERREVASEILRRSVGADLIFDQAFEQLAADVFQTYDGEEASSADGSAR